MFVSNFEGKLRSVALSSACHETAQRAHKNNKTNHKSLSLLFCVSINFVESPSI